MMPESISTAWTSIYATQRKLVVGIVIATLMTFAIVIVDLARGGRSDPPTLRAEATLLDGACRNYDATIQDFINNPVGGKPAYVQNFYSSTAGSADR